MRRDHSNNSYHCTLDTSWRTELYPENDKCITIGVETNSIHDKPLELCSLEISNLLLLPAVLALEQYSPHVIFLVLLLLHKVAWNV